MQSVYIRSISVLSILFLFTSAAAQNLDQVISKSIQPFLTDKVVSGAVTLVGQSGKITHLASHGMADLEGGRSMQKEDLFWIASMTKPMIGAAVLILQDQGKLHVDDLVEVHLEEFNGLWLLDE